jgi:hypothetical protein
MTAEDVIRRIGMKGAELKKQLGRMIGGCSTATALPPRCSLATTAS